LTEDEIDKKLKEKLAKFMNVSDVEYTDIEEIDKSEEPAEETPRNPKMSRARKYSRRKRLQRCMPSCR
jgi:hypothetical protein